jgi:hypothetical protein
MQLQRQSVSLCDTWHTLTLILGEAAGDPRQVKDRYRAEGSDAVRVGRQLLCDRAVHGPPTALEEQWASARAKAAALPTLCGLTAARAVSMQLLSAAAWDAARAETHERVPDEAL